METAGAAARKPGMGVGALEMAVNPKAGLLTAAAAPATEYAGKGFQKLGGALEGIGGRKVDVEPHMPSVSGYDPNAAFGDAAENFQPSHDPHMPNSSGYDPAAPASRNTTLKMGADPLEAVDPHMANSSGYDPAAPFGDAADYWGAADEAIDPHMPNSGGAERAAVPRTAVTETAEGGGTMYGDAPSAALPESLEALTGKSAKLADGAHGVDSLETLTDAIYGEDAPTVGNGTGDTPPSLQRLAPGDVYRDDMWGPGSVDREGLPAQAGPTRADTSGKNPFTPTPPDKYADFFRNKANLGYDPQTPTSYLEEQLAGAADPGEQAWLKKQIAARLRINVDSAVQGIKGDVK
jgi:hypothetical protein